LKDLAQELAKPTLNRFADWPAPDLPRVSAGVYAVYDPQGTFLYAGMAGATLTETRIAAKVKAGKQSGLFDRLASHATGYRSGDRFNIYIGDLFVLPTLTPKKIADIASRKSSMDSIIKKFIRNNLSFRYIVLPNSKVREFERYIQREGIDGQKPLINPLV
jgi:hypothetical protein